MIKTIKIQDLKVGMYVVLPISWFKHSFIRNKFHIKSREQIKEINESGFEEVTIDIEKGFVAEDVESVGHGNKPLTPPKNWEPEKLIPEELKAAIHDKNMAPQKKAKVVYKSSLELVSRLLDSPTSENIGEAKKGIADIVDFVISEDETGLQLLKITSHDFYTYTHSVNVGVMSIMLSKALFKGSVNHNMHELGAGFFLHDLGKVRIDPAIINKPGRLTEDEMKKMRTHPYQSYQILSKTNQLSEECKIIAMQHHEREDGSGYPRGLKGDEIHPYGRICCIADVFDALTAERSYKPKLTPFEALKVMKEEMFHHFHKEIFEKFVLLFK